MIELILKWLTFSIEKCPFLISLLCMTGIFLLLAKSIKRHSKIYYIAFALPAVLCVWQEVFSLLNIELINFYKLPVIGDIMMQYIHMTGFGYPLLVIIMYVGALNPKNQNVKNIFSIRKELSIISGFPILVHAFIRITYNLPQSFSFFADIDGYMKHNERVNSTLGQFLSNSGYILGIFMTIIFLVLWVTSFKSIHRRLGQKKWKKIQNWSYLLYAMLFLHSVLLNTGWMIDLGFAGNNKESLLLYAIGLISTCLIFISYFVLRLRKQIMNQKK